MRLSSQFMVIFLTLGLIGGTIFIDFSVNQKRDLLISQVGSKLVDIIEIKEKDIRIFVNAQDAALERGYNGELFVRFLKLVEATKEYNETIDELYIWGDNTNLERYGLANASGIVNFDSQNKFLGVDISETPIFIRMANGEKTYSTYSRPGPSDIGFALGRPVINPETNIFLGTYGFRIPLESLMDTLTPSKDLGETAEIYLVSDENLLLTPSKFLRGKNKGVLTQVIDTSESKKCFEDEGSSNSKVMTELDYRGEKTIGIYRFIEKSNWCLFAKVDESEVIDRPLNNYLLRQIAIAIFFVIIFSILGNLIGKHFDKRRRI